jgi:hypothetical protein
MNDSQYALRLALTCLIFLTSCHQPKFQPWTGPKTTTDPSGTILCRKHRTPLEIKTTYQPSGTPWHTMMDDIYFAAMASVPNPHHGALWDAHETQTAVYNRPRTDPYCPDCHIEATEIYRRTLTR